MFLKRITALSTVLATLVAACGTLPISGPGSTDTINNASLVVDEQQTLKPDFSYAVVGINDKTLEKIVSSVSEFPLLKSWPLKNEPEIIHVKSGDTIQVTIYEAQSGGLFIPIEAGIRPGNFVSLPPQTVEQSGKITVPYVGLVQAAGRTTNDISQTITRGLVDRAIEPQVVVSFTNRENSDVSVIGAVEASARFPLDFNGDRILDAIASAGGPIFPGFETYVSLQRGEEEYTIPFDQLVREPNRNVFLRSKDTVYLYRQPKRFQAYGATERQGSIDFGKRKVFLSEALGLANGLSDVQADPAEIYVYRHETSEYLMDLASYDASALHKLEKGQNVSVIYKLDLTEPNGFFWAKQFPMQDGDVIYVANAKSVEFLKFLNILGSTAVTTSNTQNAEGTF
nr:polysaccharide export protein [Cytophagales bacterium]